MDWTPKYSVGLYHHLGMADGPSMDEIDDAFHAVDRIPDLAGIEFFSGTCVTLDNAHEVKQRLDDRGLQCSMIHHGEPYIRGSFPWAAYTSPDAAERREAIDMCLHAVEVARALDGLGVYVFTPMDGADYPFQQDFRAARERTLDALREICAAAGELKVALEFRPYLPRGWATVGSMSKTLEIIGELNLPNLGAQLEVSHTFMSGENAAQAAWEAARRGLLYHVHLNDTQLPQGPIHHLRQQPPVGVVGDAPLAARGRLPALPRHGRRLDARRAHPQRAAVRVEHQLPAARARRHRRRQPGRRHGPQRHPGYAGAGVARAARDLVTVRA